MSTAAELQAAAQAKHDQLASLLEQALVVADELDDLLVQMRAAARTEGLHHIGNAVAFPGMRVALLVRDALRHL